MVLVVHGYHAVADRYEHWGPDPVVAAQLDWRFESGVAAKNARGPRLSGQHQKLVVLAPVGDEEMCSLELAHVRLLQLALNDPKMSELEQVARQAEILLSGLCAPGLLFD